MQHVSADCRLSDEEELTLLRHCVCDPADRRFDPSAHTVLSVLACKNRRSALRAAAARSERLDKEPIECVVELPPRPAERRWIYQWHAEVVDYCEQSNVAHALQPVLEEIAMKYTPTRALQLETMQALLSTLNSRGPLPAGVSISTGGFLSLYAMFNGSTEVHVHQGSCSVSFACLLLAFYAADLKEPSLLTSLLLTLARCPLLGPFLPEFVDSRKYKRRDLFTGLPLPDEAEAPLGKLIVQVVQELSDLGGTTRRREEVTSRMMQRRTEALTKARMWGGGFSGGFGGGLEAGWGGGNRTVSFGGGFNGAVGWGGYQRMEEMAEETEKCTRQWR